MSIKVQAGTKMVDINAPESVQLQISEDGKTVWVNVDGFCRFRACQVRALQIDDQRPSKSKLVISKKRVCALPECSYYRRGTKVYCCADCADIAGQPGKSKLVTSKK